MIYNKLFLILPTVAATIFLGTVLTLSTSTVSAFGQAESMNQTMNQSG